MSNQTELSSRQLSINSLFLIAIGATSWWTITILYNFSNLFYDDYRYELVEEENSVDRKETFSYYESVYDPQISPGTYLAITSILVFSMTALWARRIALRAVTLYEPNRLSKTASVWSFIAVIIALLMGVIFILATFIESLALSEDIEVLIRLMKTYVPILLTSGIVLFVVLKAFVMKPEVKND